MQLLHVNAYTFIIILSLLCSTQADWFDDLVNGLHEKIVAGADYIKDKAAPSVREKFDETKGALQDPETHRNIRLWLKEKAIPTVNEKVNSVIDFIKKNVVPQLQDIKKAYDIAAEYDKENDDKIKSS
ncbi:tRNA(Ile)-lysidine synthase [Dirofilaria immitis]